MPHRTTIMNKNICFVPLIAVSLISMAAFEMQGQTVDTEKWNVVGPASEVRNTMIYEAKSDFGGSHYESAVYGHDLDDVVKWKEGEEMPISILKIKSVAQSAFRKQFSQFSQFKVTSINLTHLTIVDDWIVQVEFDGTDWAATKPDSSKKIDVLVLLNGHVITPTVTPE